MLTPSPLQTLHHPIFKSHQLNVQIKRDDLIHPIISGNKWRKLKYNIEYAKKHGFQGIISFGGAYSNHIHALACACQQESLQSIGIIRGEPHYAKNATLSWARYWKMKLKFVDRRTYRMRYAEDYINSLTNKYPDYHLVPEGGSNALALPGVCEVIQELNEQTSFDTLITPVGSAGTLSGLISGDNGKHQILGIAVLKQADYLNDEVKKLITSANDNQNWNILAQYHRGGYAKFTDSDLKRVVEFSHITGVPFEPVYSGKMILAFLDLIEQGKFEKNQRIVLLHTGGLQGLAGLVEQGKINASEWPSPPEPPVQ